MRTSGLYLARFKLGIESGKLPPAIFSAWAGNGGWYAGTELHHRAGAKDPLRNLPTKGASSGHHSDAPARIPVQVQLVRKCESTAYPHHQKIKMIENNI